MADEKIVSLVEEIARPFETLHRIGPDGLIYPYHDDAGYPTQGWGRLLSRIKWEDLSKYKPITKDEAEEWLHQDISKAIRAVGRLVKVEISDEQAAALADFAFNCGAGNLQLSTLLRMVNRGEAEMASNEFAKWVYAGGVKMRGLVRRRAAERKLFDGRR